jgi:hypothetical protein
MVMQKQGMDTHNCEFPPHNSLINIKMMSLHSMNVAGDTVRL